MLSPPLYRAPKNLPEGGKYPRGEREETTGSVLEGIRTRLLHLCWQVRTRLPRIAGRRAGSWHFGLVTTASCSHEDSDEQNPTHKFSQLREAHCFCNCHVLDQLLLTAWTAAPLEAEPQCLSQRTISVNSL